MKYKYPIVECKTHGEQESYVVCQHVISGARPSHVRPSSREEMGEILCGDCDDGLPDAIDACKIVCAAHAREFLGKKLVN